MVTAVEVTGCAFSLGGAREIVLKDESIVRELRVVDKRERLSMWQFVMFRARSRKSRSCGVKT